MMEAQTATITKMGEHMELMQKDVSQAGGGGGRPDTSGGFRLP